jgi:hypothetical protein
MKKRLITVSDLEKDNRSRPRYEVTYNPVSNDQVKYTKYFQYAHDALSFIKDHELQYHFEIYKWG